jgi:hypothetical protein
MTIGEYLVTGKRNYRGHEPGTIFEARLNPNAEARAINRGDIRLLRQIEPTIQPGSYTFPDGWLTDAATTTQQNQGG